MTARLAALCGLIERTESFIDVGCDHGFAVKYVFDNALADKIAACDISQKSLNKAKELLKESAGISFVCADGATAAKGYETVLVAGMGGLEIVSVTENCEPKTYILSPQSHAREVRVSLLRRDYDIVYDKVIKDGRKFYDVIKAERGGGKERLKSANELMLKFGMFADEHNDALCERLRIAHKTLCAFVQTKENAEKKREIEEVLKWQSR